MIDNKLNVVLVVALWLGLCTAPSLQLCTKLPAVEDAGLACVGLNREQCHSTGCHWACYFRNGANRCCDPHIDDNRYVHCTRCDECILTREECMPHEVFCGRVATTATECNAIEACIWVANSTNVPPPPPPPEPEPKSSSDINLVKILVPLFTGLAAICTIAYTIYKCFLKGRYFKDFQNFKIAKAQDTASAAPKAASKTEKKGAHKSDIAASQVCQDLPPSYHSQHKSVEDGGTAIPAYGQGDTRSLYPEGQSGWASVNPAFLPINGPTLYPQRTGDLPSYMLPPHTRNVR